MSRNIPRLQKKTFDYTRRKGNLVAGLDYDHEILSPMDVDYYCKLCDWPSKAASIMPHLVGFKHQLNVVRKIYPRFYDLNKDSTPQDRYLRKQINFIIWSYEKKERTRFHNRFQRSG